MWRYSHTSIFTRLPLELVDEIARYSEPCELQALCLVSKHTGDVATRRLYHTIVLEKKNTVQCFKTLTQNQDVANYVRRMAIDVVEAHGLFGNFYQLAVAALKRTTNLIGLDISGLGPLLSLLAEIHFPRLAEVKIPYATAITRFLQTNHQHLKTIVVEGPQIHDAFELSSQHFKNVQLPELLAFVGPCNVIPHVIPGSQVQYLTICWEPGCERLEEIVRSVAQSRNEVLGIDNLVLGWNPGLLNVISDSVPRLERLRIRSVCPLTSREMIKSYLLYLEEGLNKFQRLHTLAVTILFNPYAYRLVDLDHEYDLLRRWGALLPTLMVCTLPSMTRWTRFKDSHWFPIVDPKNDPYRKLKIHWLFRAFKNGTFPSELFAQISGGIKFEDVEAMVHTDYFLEDGEYGGMDSGWEWEDEEDTDFDWLDEGDDEMSDWGSSGEEGDSEWESEREEEDDVD